VHRRSGLHNVVSDEALKSGVEQMRGRMMRAQPRTTISVYFRFSHSASLKLNKQINTRVVIVSAHSLDGKQAS